MKDKKQNFQWEYLAFGVILGGIFAWLVSRLDALKQGSKAPSTPAKESPSRPPSVSTADYETWLDWLVNNRRAAGTSIPVPDVSQYQTWLYPFFRSSRFHWLLTAVLASFVTFLFGLVLSISFGFFELFINTPAIYLAVAGTAMGLATFYWVGRAFPPAFAALAPYFGVPPDEFSGFLNTRLKKMYDRRGMLMLSGAVVIASFAAMVAVFLYPETTYPFLTKYAPSLVMLEKDWYFGGANFAKMLIIDLYFLINFSLVISGAWLCIHALVLLYQLAALPIVPIPSVLSLKLKKIGDIFLVVCLVWLSASAIFVLLFFESVDILSLIWIGSQMILTMVTFLLPQFLSRRVILNLREELITATRLAFDKYFAHFDSSQVDPQKRLKLINELSAEANSIKAWPTEPFDWLLMMAGQALPPASAFLRDWIQTNLL